MFKMADLDKISRLTYSEELLPMADYIAAHYDESDQTVYRSVLSVPPGIIDSTPQSKRDIPERGEELILTLTDEEVASMSDEDKKEYVANLAISVFKSLPKCQANIKSLVKHIARKYSYEEAEKYLKDSRGPFIVKIQLDESIGLLEKRFDKKGHGNLLMYEGKRIDDYIVEVYDPLDMKDLLDT